MKKKKTMKKNRLKDDNPGEVKIKTKKEKNNKENAMEKENIKIQDEDSTTKSCTCTCGEHAISTPIPVKKSGIATFGFITFILLLLPIILNSAFHLAFSPVLTGSMRPHFNPGDILITKQILASEVKVGEIAVLRNGESYDLYSHRIVSITPNKTSPNILDIKTKGDNNPTVDAQSVEINKFATIPVGVGRIPWAGRVIVTFTNSKGKFIGYFFILIFIIIMVPAIFKKKPDSVNTSKRKLKKEAKHKKLNS